MPLDGEAGHTFLVLVCEGFGDHSDVLVTEPSIHDLPPLLGQGGEHRKPGWSRFGQSEIHVFQHQSQGELFGVVALGDAAELAGLPAGNERTAVEGVDDRRGVQSESVGQGRRSWRLLRQ
jgi:hypothetical protein